MREALIAALKDAPSADQVADAIDAGLRAAHTSTTRHGYEAVLEVLERPAPAQAVVSGNSEMSAETGPTSEEGIE